MIKVILASKSEIRKRMLEKLGINFEIFVSDADETADLSKSFEEQLKEISMRKAKIVFEKTKKQDLRLIVAADQNIVFEDKMYGKPQNLDEAKNLIGKMCGSDKIFAYTGNSLILANGANILKTINCCDIARLKMNNITDEELNKYIQESNPLTKCGGITIENCSFINLVEGKLSTALGMTTEYLIEILNEYKTNI